MPSTRKAPMIYDYNVWSEDDHASIDYWTEDEQEAREVAATYHATHGVRPTTSKYQTRTMPDGTYQTDTSTQEVL
jgi:hypothetical protein